METASKPYPAGSLAAYKIVNIGNSKTVKIMDHIKAS
jgi:hypothetical protein